MYEQSKVQMDSLGQLSILHIHPTDTYFQEESAIEQSSNSGQK
jgi:hypothetical protein